MCGLQAEVDRCVLVENSETGRAVLGQMLPELEESSSTLQMWLQICSFITVSWCYIISPPCESRKRCCLIMGSRFSRCSAVIISKTSKHTRALSFITTILGWQHKFKQCFDSFHSTERKSKPDLTKTKGLQKWGLVSKGKDIVDIYAPSHSAAINTFPKI